MVTDRKTLTGYSASYEFNKNGDLYLKKYRTFDLKDQTKLNLSYLQEKSS